MDAEIHKLVNRINNLEEIDEDTEELMDKLYELVENRLEHILVTVTTAVAATVGNEHYDWIVDKLLNNPLADLVDIIEEDVVKNTSDYTIVNNKTLIDVREI